VETGDWDSVGTLLFTQTLPSDDLRISVRLSLRPGPNGYGEGFALALLDVPHFSAPGTGGGCLGVTEVPGCRSAVVVEIDTVSESPGDFRPIGYGIPHTGIAYLPGGSVSGLDFIPTQAAADLISLAGGEALELILTAAFTDDTVTVQCRSEGMDSQILFSTKLQHYLPFEARLVLAAANGKTAGDTIVRSVRVERHIPSPPLFNATVRGHSVDLSWSGRPSVHNHYELRRNGEFLAAFPANGNSAVDEPGGYGRYLYTLIAFTANGEQAPPVQAAAYVGEPFLVVDAGMSGEKESPAGAAWLQILKELGLPFVRVTSLKDIDPGKFRAVLWIGGSGRAQRAFFSSEEEKLAAYTAGSKVRILFEGADLWSMPRSEKLSGLDGVALLSDGWPTQSVFCLPEGTRIPYSGFWSNPDLLRPAPEEISGKSEILWTKAGWQETQALSICAYTPDLEKIIVNSSLELFRIPRAGERMQAAELVLSLLQTPPPRELFTRGDVTDDGEVDIGDAVSVLGYLFGGKEDPVCPDAADANDDGRIQISDVITLLAYLFGGGSLSEPAPPSCGHDPTSDSLRPCASVSCRP